MNLFRSLVPHPGGKPVLHELRVEGRPVRGRDQPLPGVDPEAGDELDAEPVHVRLHVGVLRISLHPALPHVPLHHL